MTLDATVLDLSTSGMGLATAVAAPKPSVGDACAFELTVDGVRIEGRGVLVWSRRARPDRGDAPNVGVRFEQLDGSALRDLTALVEPRLAAGRWSAVADPLLAPSMAFDPIPEVPSAPAQQLTLPVAATAVAAAAVVAPVVEKPSPTVRNETATQQPAAEPVVQATRPAPPTAPPTAVTLPPSAPPFHDLATAPKSRAVMWIALAAAAVVVALLVWFLVGGRGETEAPVAASVGDSVNDGSEPIAPPAVAEVVDAAISTDGATGDAVAAEAVVQPANLESAAMEAEAAAIAATQASLAAESEPVESAVEPASAPAHKAAGARRVIALDHGVDGSAEVLALRFDVPLAEDDVFAALIGPDPPRYLLRLRGIDQPWRPPELVVGGPLVQRVRTGLHSTPRGPELHIVIDLSTRAVEHSWTIEGDALRVRLTPRAP